MYGDIGLKPSDLAEMTYADLFFCVQGRIEYQNKRTKDEWLRTCYLVASIASMLGEKVDPFDLMPFGDYQHKEIPEVPDHDWKRLDDLIEKYENGRS